MGGTWVGCALEGIGFAHHPLYEGAGAQHQAGKHSHPPQEQDEDAASDRKRGEARCLRRSAHLAASQAPPRK